MKRICIFLIVGVCTTILLLAQEPVKQSRPARKDVIAWIQPNGDTLHIRMYGDENKHVTVTDDNYIVRENKHKWYCYIIKDHKTFKTSKIHARDSIKRDNEETFWVSRKGIKRE